MKKKRLPEMLDLWEIYYIGKSSGVHRREVVAVVASSADAERWCKLHSDKFRDLGDGLGVSYYVNNSRLYWSSRPVVKLSNGRFHFVNATPIKLTEVPHRIGPTVDVTDELWIAEYDSVSERTTQEVLPPNMDSNLK